MRQQVAGLEDVIGLRLFDRTTRRITLTRAGRDFLASAQTTLRHAQVAETAAADLRNRTAGLVRAGAPLVLAATALPAAAGFAEHLAGWLPQWSQGGVKAARRRVR